jgi:hypothetical protein
MSSTAGQSFAKTVANRITVRAIEQVYGSAPKHVVPLADGSLGYRTRRDDDCFAAALATCLQIPIEQVPDPQIDRRLAVGESAAEIVDSMNEELRSWLADRGLAMVTHHKVPPPRRRWIGIVPIRGDFQDHCLVFDRDQLLFEPAGWRAAVPLRLRHVAWGISFQSIRTRQET